MPLLDTSAPPRHRRRTNQKRPVLGVTSLGVVAQWGPTGPQIFQAIANGIGYSPELNGVILSLKISYMERTSWFRLQLVPTPWFSETFENRKTFVWFARSQKNSFLWANLSNKVMVRPIHTCMYPTKQHTWNCSPRCHATKRMLCSLPGFIYKSCTYFK